MASSLTPTHLPPTTESKKTTRLPRLRRAVQSDHASPGVDSPPRDFLFHDCVVMDDPKLLVHVTYYDKNPDEHPDAAPVYKREMEVSSKEGVTFSTFWHQNKKMSEKIAEKGEDEQLTWCLGLAEIKGVDYVRLKILEGW